MAYLVTARKWRPMLFDDIIGQQHIATTLRNAIATNRLSHAYIFSGPRGVGKTTTARILAKAVNCLNPQNYNPDNKCELCVEITEGRSVNVFEIDGASNRSVEEVRNLREAVRYGPTKGKYKIYIIDEVHMLTKEAFNALLKTLEEPPYHVMFIFATTEIYKIPLTILSRCQRFDFRRISINEIISRLRFISNEENIQIDDNALLIIAKRADGSMRDAQSLFDQVVSFCGDTVKSEQIIPLLNIVDQEIYFRITDIVKQKDIKAGLLLVDEIVGRGYDLRDFLNGLMEHFRNILLALATSSTSLIETSEIYKQKYEQIAKLFSETELLRLIKITTDMDSAIRWNQQPRLRLEMGLVQMIKLDSTVEISKLLKEIDELKKNLNGSTGEIIDDSKNTKYTTSTLIKGNVKATPPTLRADQIVDLKNNVSDFSTSYRLNDPPKNTAMQEGDIFGKWLALIKEVKKERIDLGTMLGDTALLEIDNNRLCIGCPDGFHLEALNAKRNYYYLQKLVEKVYGFKLRLEAKISTTMASQAVDLDKKTNESQNQTKSEFKQHPVVQALIKEFGAREIK